VSREKPVSASFSVKRLNPLSLFLSLLMSRYVFHFPLAQVTPSKSGNSTTSLPMDMVCGWGLICGLQSEGPKVHLQSIVNPLKSKQRLLRNLHLGCEQAKPFSQLIPWVVSRLSILVMLDSWWTWAIFCQLASYI